jgi:DNA-directed RNA polymerase specialized sigma24 family protein
MIDLERYQARARRYLAARGVPEDLREDLVQEICLEVLERPGEHLNLEHLARHALDRLDPRRWVDGERVREHTRFQSLDAPLYPDHEDHDAVTALDRLTTSTPVVPGTRQGTRTRHQHREPDQSFTDYLATLPAQGRLRAIKMLTELYGYTQAEVGVLFGVTESRISQLLAAPPEDGPPPRDPVVDDLCLACQERPRHSEHSRCLYCTRCAYVFIRHPEKRPQGRRRDHAPRRLQVVGPLRWAVDWVTL